MTGLTAVFRGDAVRHQVREVSGMHNPGGGLSTKCRYLRQAFPGIEFVSDFARVGKVVIVDALWFTGGSDTMDACIGAYCGSDALKILWTSDFELLRWRASDRERVLDGTDIIAGNSPYMVSILENLFDSGKVGLLTDPIDTDVPGPSGVRSRCVYACSHVVLEKGIDEVIALYRCLANERRFGAPLAKSGGQNRLERHFIGSSVTWGLGLREVDSFDLELQLGDVCRHTWAMSNDDVREFARRAWMFVSFARFETFGYAMVEALLGGCYVFAYPHLAYQERIAAGVVRGASRVEEMYSHIMALVESEKLVPNAAGVQFVRDNYSLPVFRGQLRDLVGGAFGV